MCLTILRTLDVIMLKSRPTKVFQENVSLVQIELQLNSSQNSKQNAEAYLEPSRTSVTELFCEDSQRLKAPW